MFVSERGDRLQFHENFVEADQVSHVALLERLALVGNRNGHLRAKGDALKTQLQLEALLINGFEKSAPLIFLNLKTSALVPIPLVFLSQFTHGRFLSLCVG